MRTFAPLALLVVCIGLLAAAQSAEAVTYSMGQPDPFNDGFNTNTVPNSLRGWRFQVNSPGITVSELGAYYPDSNSLVKTVVLWSLSPQTIIAQADTTVGAGWRWTTLLTPVTLTQGQQYIVVGFTTNQYFYQSNPPPAYKPTGTIQYMDMRYANNCTPATFPNSTLSNYQYGVVDIGYSEGPNIVDPAPGTSLPEATEGQTNYSVDFEAANGSAPYTWGGGASVLPAFLEFNPALGNPVQLVEVGAIGAAGSYTVDVEVEDGGGNTKLESYDLVVNPPPVLTGPAVLPDLTEGYGYPTPPVFTLSGGTAPITWTVSGGPTGLAITGSGVLNGPVDPGTAGGSPYSVTVTVEDANGVQDSLGPFDLTVNTVPIIAPVSPPNAPLGLPYDLPLMVTGGSAPLTWMLTGAVGPFVIDANTGVITGTPATLGTFAFDAEVTDACGAMDTVPLSIDIIDPPTAEAPGIPALTEGVDVPAGIFFTATGGDPSQYDWSHSGSLPSGVSLDNVVQGAEVVYELTGTPTFGAAGVYPLDVMVTDNSTTLTNVVSVTITVNAPPVIDIMAGLTLPGATHTGAWSFTFAEVAGTGTAPLTWSLGTVTGPDVMLPGFDLVDATLSTASAGSPTGTYTVDVTLTDANGASDTQTFTLTINPTPEFPVGFPYAQEGSVYLETLSVTEGTGTAPFGLAVVQDLPGELMMTTSISGGDVTVEGTPAGGMAGQYELTVNITDANNVSTLATIQFVITAKPTSSSCCGMTQPRSNAGTLLLLALLATMGVGVLRRRVL